ncbi:MAG: ribosome small subunit-dependent GTPase A [Balneolaceae bacterium]
MDTHFKKLKQLGFTDSLIEFVQNNNLESFEIGRISTEHKDRYIVKTVSEEFNGEITGNLRFTAGSRDDLPAVGDWVAFQSFEEMAIIHKILPRYSTLKRHEVGSISSVQIIATNIDFAFLIQAVDRDFNLNRLERYLTMCYTSKVEPIIVLTKTDLIDQDSLLDLKKQITERIPDVELITISNISLSGIDELKSKIIDGKTYCLLGSSGVGKSTLLNNLIGSSQMRTGSISSSNQKGQHVTTHRELIVLDPGGIIIDNPGMREIGIVDEDGGLEITFDQIMELGKQCKYKDCRHISESNCAVLEAVESGEIDQAVYNNYLKMDRERTFFETSSQERKRKDKELGKLIKNMKRDNIKGRR